MNDNCEIFEVPGVYENPRRQTLTLALTVYVKCLKYMKLGDFDTKFTNEQYFVVNLLELIWIPELWINYYSQTLYLQFLNSRFPW
jgi:hypothetical protein